MVTCPPSGWMQAAWGKVDFGPGVWFQAFKAASSGEAVKRSAPRTDTFPDNALVDFERGLFFPRTQHSTLEDLTCVVQVWAEGEGPIPFLVAGVGAVPTGNRE